MECPGWATATFDADGARAIETGGVADLVTGAPIAATTRFRWFSVTKVVTALAILRAVEGGRLGLEDDVRERLPWFRPRARVTPRHLLSHASGLADPISFGWVHPPGRPRRSDAELTRATFARYARLRSAPGAIARYTNLGYLVLGELLEVVEGDYARAAQDVLSRAGATTASFTVGPSARGHEPLRSARTAAMAVIFGRRTPRLVAYARAGWVGLTPFELEGRAYGGLIGSIEDLVALGRALLVSDVVVSDASLRAMRRRVATGPRGAHGLSLWHHQDGWVGHGGEAGGYRAEVHVDPRRGVGVAVLTNAGTAATGAKVEELKRLTGA
ncbi:MAG: beta-lactamase family protein [Sandaracinaceae bacterium]|nr:beta-lactamase family protein [Sandaracinaceae bacterium]